MNKKLTRVLSFVLGAVMVTTSVSAATPAIFNGAQMPDGYNVKADSAINSLKVNSMPVPFGIDTPNPTFSWMLNLPGYGRAQSAYRVIVASTPEKAKAHTGDLWDTQKISDKDNYNVVYDGVDLTSKTQYYWAVEVWDETGASLGWSDVATFETAIMTTEEWQGEWIGRGVVDGEQISPEGTKWIWFGNGKGGDQIEQGYNYFRKGITPDPNKTIERVLLGFTADNVVYAYVNGELVESNKDWGSGKLVNVTDKFTQGQNILAFEALNTEKGFAGMIARAEILYTDGSVDSVMTDETWKVSLTKPDGWAEKGFDDSSWRGPDQTNVVYGASPWYKNAKFAFAKREAIVLRKEFSADKGEIESARAYISGLGFFEMRINGQLPDDTVMNSRNTQYTQTVPYQTFDVTKFVKAGKNAIGVELGNNFYNETDGVWGWGGAAWRDDPKLRMELVVTYKNGETESIVTDQSWKVTNLGPTTTNSIYLGETYDARRELPGFSEPDYVLKDESKWIDASIAKTPTGELKAQTMEPIRRTKEMKPSEIKKLDNGSYIVSVPEMLAGWIKLNIKNPTRDQKITITYGEKLMTDPKFPELLGQVQKLGGGITGIGNVNEGWWPTAYNQQDNYICKGDAVETFEPRFSYKGYQYVQIDNYPGELTVDDITCYRTSNDMPVTGNFETSNAQLNKMHQMMMTTMDNNMQGKPTDTPMWEKNGWLGDANVAKDTFTYNYDFQAMMESFIETMEDCQDDFNTVPVMVPTAGWGADQEPSVVWNSIFVLGVEQLFDVYGNESYIADQYDNMRKLAVQVQQTTEKYGYTWSKDPLADWVSPVGSKEEDQDMGYSEPPAEGCKIVGSGFAYRTLDVMAQFADKLGRTEDAASYRATMALMYDAFNKAFYVEDGGYYETGDWGNGQNRTKFRQTSQLIPLAFGMVPEDRKESVVNSLVNDIKEKNYHLSTGSVGSKLLLPVLTENGYTDVAYRLALQTTYPSWGFMAERGTSMWEMWETTSRSLGHYFLGTFDEWFYNGIGGIKEIKDGYKNFTIEPQIGGDLTYAKTSVDTVRGLVKSNWVLNADKTATFDMVVPMGSTAKIVLPATEISGVTIDGKVVSDQTPGVQKVEVVDGKVEITAESGSYVFKSALGGYEVYKGALETAIASADKLIESDYYQEAWGAFKAVLDNAKAVYASETATQSVVNETTEALEKALVDIEQGVNPVRAELKKVVADVKALFINPAEYKLGDYTLFATALKKADDASSNTALTDQELLTLQSNLEKALQDLQAKPVFTNLALKTPVTSKSNHEGGERYGWSKGKLNDGDRKNINPDNEYVGYSSAVGVRNDHEEFVSVDLGSVQDVNTVSFYSAIKNWKAENTGYGFPKSFDIRVSDDGKNWTTVKHVENYPVPSYGPLNFSFDTVSARHVQLYALSLNEKINDGGQYFLQLSEMEVYNVVDPATSNELDTLKTAIDKATALVGSDEYNNAVPVVKETFDAALARANVVYGNSKATRAQVFEAQAALIKAIQLLGVQQGDKTELQALYDEWANVDLNLYVDGLAKENFKTALAAAKTVLDDPNAVQKSIDEAYDNLKLTSEQLELRPEDSSKEILKIVIDYAKAQKEDGGEYHNAIESVKASYDAALANAETVYADANASATAIESAWTSLMKEIHKLGFIAGDKAQLIRDYELYSALDLSAYLDGAEKDAFKAALVAAKAVIDDGDAMQTEITNASKALVDAFNALVPNAADKTQLGTSIDAANEVNGSLNNYVTAGKEEFTKALENANAVMNNASATQQMIDDAKTQLVEAMLKLRLKADKTLLQNAADKANAVDVAQYTAASVERFNAEKAKADEMLANEELSVDDQDAVNVAAMSLEAAINALEPVNAPTVDGDSNMNTNGSSAKTGDTAALPLAMAAGIAALAFAGYAISKKRK